MSIKKQEIHHVAYDRRRLQSLFLRAVDDKVPAEATGLLDVRKRRIEQGGTVEWDVREGRGAVRARAVGVLPFVQVVSTPETTDISTRKSEPALCGYSRHVPAKRIVRYRE